MWKSIQSVAAASFAVSQEVFYPSKKKDGICHLFVIISGSVYLSEFIIIFTDSKMIMLYMEQCK
jgi:hypothetical protein